MSETIYFNSARGKKTMYGTKISFNVEKLIEELKQYKNESGYCNVVIKDRKSPDKYGNNVYIVLDTWKPDPTKSKQVNQATAVGQSSPSDDLPF